MKKLITVLLVVFWAGISFAGPFGFEMGMKPEDVNITKKLSPFLYVVRDMPVKHPSFESSVLQICPSTGLSYLKIIGNSLDTNSYGTSLQAEFANIVGQLEKTYGKPTEIIDGLFPNSVWRDSNQWMMSLELKERELIAYWGKVGKDNIDEIYVGVRSLSLIKGYVTVEYHFTN